MGYPASAAKFAKEANIQPRVGVDTIKDRLEVRDLIYREDILSAIEKINDLDPLVSSSTFREDEVYHFASIRCYDDSLFMHHSYVPCDIDESKTNFSLQSEQPNSPSINYRRSGSKRS